MASESSTSNAKKPENIIWVEEVLLNHLDVDMDLFSSSVHPSGSVSPSESKPFLKTGEQLESISAAAPPPPSQTAERDNKLKNFHHSLVAPDITIAEIEFKDEGFLGDERIQCLSRIVTGKIKYTVGNKKFEEEKFSHWLIKLPNLVSPQRQLSQMIDASRREIGFYTEILPSIRGWLAINPPSQHIELQVPLCYYGKFNRPIDKDPDFDVITHILEAESILALEDLRAVGYGKRHFSSSLLVSETLAAIDEIVKFHVITFAMEETSQSKLSWAHLFDWQQFARLYSNLLDKCFPSLKNFLSESSHPKSSQILSRLIKLRPQLYKRFLALLKPPSEPLPITMVHMDLWSENILFRTNPFDKEDGVPMEEAELDCCILDWQMVSYGSPTHDLALLLMLSLDPADRKGNDITFLKYYYDSFRKTAKYFNLEVSFTFQMMAEEFKRSCTLATFMAMASMDVILMEESTQNRLLEALVFLMDEKLI